VHVEPQLHIAYGTDLACATPGALISVRAVRMRVLIVPKAELSAEQLAVATRRIFAPEHAFEIGPWHFWNRPEHDRHNLALFDLESQEFVGTVHCILMPPVAQDFTWWLDSRLRKKGYWTAIADDVAAYLKRRRGVASIGFILFGGGHVPASRKIAERLRSHFKEGDRRRPGR